MSESTIDLLLELDDDESLEALTKRAARKRGVSLERLGPIEILKRSIDARRGRVRIRYLVRERQSDSPPLGGEPLRECRGGVRVAIVGGGPAGLFCAYQLARHGIASVVLERGKKVQPRRHDLKGLTKGGVVDADSNYCYGEGGAGTYSDGKLYTRAHKRGDVRDVIEVFVKAGAPAEILTDARPHIGSNKLPKVVTCLREQLEEVGVVFRFGAKVVGLEKDGKAVTGVKLACGEVVSAESVVMATGHSARDVYSLLEEAGAEMESKGFAVGVRIEHPQSAINRIQYGKAAGHPKLPAAAYRLVQDIRGRGVFSFCMCPGGWIVPASTEAGALVVNGMSLSKRDSPYANSGMVIGLSPEDWQDVPGLGGPLGGVVLQRRIEEAAWQGGGGGLVAPATRLGDFLEGWQSSSLPATSYVPGLQSADMEAILDSGGVPIAARLREAFECFGKRLRGFVSDDAVLVGVESRTSAPVRVMRDGESLESTSLESLYPCGEGAGYAGGIVSAAMDGMRVARAIVVKYKAG
ncbi:MAG: FAD-dependent oxidoreductase [Myxococcales bacterium]|nr:FAD-dependent oxidoreductase [Myxococcales bacterium]